MAAFNKFDSFVEAVTEKVHNLQSDDLRVLLTNTAPVASNTQKSNLTEIGAGNGYTAGGNAAVQSSSAQTAGLYKLIAAAVVFTAAGGNIGPFRYAVLYNNTATNKELIGWWDYGVALTLTNGNSFTVALDPVNGVLTLQ